MNRHRIRTAPEIYIMREIELVAEKHASGFKFVQKVGSKAVKLTIVLHDVLQLFERLIFLLAGVHV